MYKMSVQNVKETCIVDRKYVGFILIIKFYTFPIKCYLIIKHSSMVF